MVIAPPQLVDGVPRTPHPYGLFTVVTPREQGDPHWQNGVEWESLPCRNPAGIGTPDCDPDTPTPGTPKNFNKAGPVINTASPFTVYAPYNCAPVGHTLTEGQDIATQQLLAEEQNYVEWELWSGHLGSEPTLPGSAEPITDLGPLDPLVALAALEAWYHGHSGTVNGQAGYVHMGVGAATILAKKAALQYRNGGVYTPAGSRVIIGTGYGSAALQDDGSLTDRIYITPPLLAYRSEIFTSSNREGDLLDRRTNDLYAIAERTYLVGWDDCPASAFVDLQYPIDAGRTIPTPQYPFEITTDDGTEHAAGNSFGVYGTGRPGATVTGTSVAAPSGTTVTTDVTVPESGTWMLNFNEPSADDDTGVDITAREGLRTDSVSIVLT